jgi:hypothetical protein
MPVATTENFIHVIVEDPAHFKTCRTTDFNGKLPAGVQCHYCQRKSGSWDIQSYLFDRKNWDEEKAKAWVDAHKQKQARMSFDAVSEPYELQGKLFLKIPIMPDGPSLNEWGVTPEARARCASTVLGKKLLGPPTSSIPGDPTVCRTCGPDKPHAQPEEGWAEYGHFVDFTNNGKTYGIAEITAPDEEVRQAIRERRLSAVSPSVFPKAGFYDDKGLIVTDYVFDHVLFVDHPAFHDLSLDEGLMADSPDLTSASWHSALQAAFVPSSAQKARQDVGAQSPTSMQSTRDKISDSPGGGIVENQTPLQAADAWDTQDAPDKYFAYVPSDGNPSDRKLPLASKQKKALDEAIVKNAMARFSQTDLPASVKAHAKGKICSAAKSLGIDSPFCSEQGGIMSVEQGCKDCEQSKKTITELQGKLVTTEAGLTALMKWKDEQVMQARLTKANRIADLEIQIGTLQAKDRDARVKLLVGIDDAALGPLLTNLESVGAAQAAIQPPGPKAKFDGNAPMQGAAGALSFVESRRMTMFGYTRDKTGKIVGGAA